MSLRQSSLELAQAQLRKTTARERSKGNVWCAASQAGKANGRFTRGASPHHPTSRDSA